MTTMTIRSLPRLHHLPATMPEDGAIRISLKDGTPIFRASDAVQARIEALLRKQQTSQLSSAEEDELDRYEEIDDYLSFINRVVRNLLQNPELQG